MELTTEAELYVPSMDETGNYIDKTPAFKKGIRCPCGCRKDKVYETTTIFTNHLKTKSHQKWLLQINNNKSNLFAENEQMKTNIHNQRLVIARMDIELQNKNRTIDILTQQLYKATTAPTPNKMQDLLDL